MWIRLSSFLLIFLLIGCANAPTASDGPMELAIVQEFDGFAQLLRERGQSEDASTVAGYAQTMRQSEQVRRQADQAYREGRPFETSFYMGFDPSKVLTAYSTDLSAAGRTTDAARVASLAQRWRAEQEAAAKELLRGPPG